MADFSWSDSFHAALAPCVGCLRTKPTDPDDDVSEHGPHYVPRARPDELEGLLADTDADTMSLHSNVGSRRRKRRGGSGLSRPQRSIRVFGFYLFGRPPIHLPDDEDEQGSDDARARARVGYQDRARTISASTLDSDASPLDASAIDELSAARLAEQVREQERAAKEERQRRRRERKQREREELSRALDAHGEAFEGFQGSGASPGVPQHQHQHHRHDSETYTHTPSLHDEFGPFQDAQELDADGIDFGAEHYTRSDSSRRTGSDSQSRTSASASVSGVSSPSPDPAQYNHHYQYLSQQPTGGAIMHVPIGGAPSKKNRKSRSSRHSTSSGSGSASQSTSVKSPPPQQTTFPDIAEAEQEGPEPESVPVYANDNSKDPEFPSTGLGLGFPSTGFGDARSRKNSDAGVFLATRG